MSPTSWAIPEQEVFLQEFFAEFIQCQAKRDYSGFWPPFFERWFEKYPEWAELFPDTPANIELSEEQKASLAEAVETRKDQLHNKLRNKWGAKRKTQVAKDADTKASTLFIAGLIQSKEVRKCKPQKIEAYLSLYYEEKVHPTIEGTHEVGKADAIAAVSSGGLQAEKLPPKLATIMNKTHELFKNKSPEVMAKVEERWKEMVAEKEQRNERKIKDTQHVLMGGPMPEAGGKTESCSLHISVTELDNMFDQFYPEFNNGIMRPYREFLDRVTAPALATKEESLEEAIPVPGPSGLSSTHVTDVTTSGTGCEAQALTSVSDMGKSVPTLPAPPLLPTSASWSALDNLAGFPLISLDGGLDEFAGPPLVSPGAATTLDEYIYDFGSHTAIDHLDNFLAKYGCEPPLQPLHPSNTTLLPSASTSGGHNLALFEHIVASASAEVTSLGPLEGTSMAQSQAVPAMAPSTVQTRPNESAPTEIVSRAMQSQLIVPDTVQMIPSIVQTQQTQAVSSGGQCQVINCSPTPTVSCAMQSPPMAPSPTQVVSTVKQAQQIAPRLSHSDNEPTQLAPHPSDAGPTQADSSMVQTQAKGPSGKRTQQPSKRNQVANLIGVESSAPKKRSAASSGVTPATAKKRKTK